MTDAPVDPPVDPDDPRYTRPASTIDPPIPDDEGEDGPAL